MSSSLSFFGDEGRTALLRAQLDASHDAVVIVGRVDEATLCSAAKEHTDKMWIVAGPDVERTTAAVIAVTGLPGGRVMGTGTIAASLRLHDALATRLKVHPSHVSVFLAGEAGPRATPLWSRATVAGIPLHEWAVPGHGKLSVRDRIDLTIAARVVRDDDDAIAITALLVAIGDNEQRILPVSQPLPAFDGAVLSFPAIVGALGAERPLPMPLNDNETAGLRDTATRTLA